MEPTTIKLPDGSTKTIVDEMCSCGHKRSDHCDRYAEGHGACRFVGCDCEQFSWHEFVFAPE